MTKTYVQINLRKSMKFKNGLTHEQLEFLIDARNSTLMLLKSLEESKNDKASDVSTVLSGLESLLEDTFSGLEE